jgi:hypothetical protein
MEMSGQLHSPAVLTPGGRAPGTNWRGGWVGPRSGPDTGEEKNILSLQELNPGLQASRLSLYLLSYPGLLIITATYE